MMSDQRTGIAEIPIEDIIDADRAGFLRQLALAAFGTSTVSDVQYTIIGVPEIDVLRFSVQAQF
jgi:hypothetical protein